MQRRNVLVALGAAFVAGCSKISDSKWFGALVDGAEGWHRGVHRTLGAGRIALALMRCSARVSTLRAEPAPMSR